MAWKVLGHFQADFILLWLAASQVSQLQGYSPFMKAQVVNRETEGGPQNSPIAELRKKDALSCILW